MKEELITEKRKLSDELMNKVNGGYIYRRAGKFEVVDIRGKTVKICDTYDEAYDLCVKYNLRVFNLTTAELQERIEWWEDMKKYGETDENFEMIVYGRVLNGEML